MTTKQIIEMIIGGVSILVVIGIGLFSKEKKQEVSTADFKLDEELIAQDMSTQTSTIEESTTEIYEEDTALVPDNALLIARYKNAAHIHKKSFKYINRNIYFFFVYQGIMLTVALCFMGSIGIGRDDYSGIMTIILVAGITIYLASVIYYFSNKNKSIATTLSSPKYVLLNENQFPAIRQCCQQLMEKMELSEYSLFIYYVKTDGFEASVLTNEQDINLLLSRSLITYFKSNPKEVESILCHEFGHVYQGDTTMLLVNRNSIQVPGIIGSISLVVFVIAAMISYFQGNGFTSGGGNIIIVYYYWSLVNHRREAEFLADMASLSFVENSTIEVLLEKYIPQQGTFNYPSRQQRLTFLNLVKKAAATDQKKKAIQTTSSKTI